MPMNFFNFPAEIRLQIYEELLVLPEPILFITNRGDPPLLLRNRYGLCPALLQANKTVHREASPLLYSGNCFGFTDLLPSRRFASFLSQTGQNASFLRHIYIDFPLYNYQRPTFQEDSMKMLELIRDNCTGIAILETLLNKWPLECYKDVALELLDTRFKAIPSLKEVIVQVHTYIDIRDDSLKRMRNYGWTIKVTKLEMSKEDYSYRDIDSNYWDSSSTD
jgi:hypothetical protein